MHRLLLALLMLWIAGCPDFPADLLHLEAGSDVRCGDADGDGVDRCAGDCHDQDRRVHSGQIEYFGAAAEGVGFDYNCDGVVDLRYPDAVVCTADGLGCRGDGWGGDPPAVPSCGDEGEFISCARTGQRCQERPVGPRQQLCR